MDEQREQRQKWSTLQRAIYKARDPVAKHVAAANVVNMCLHILKMGGMEKERNELARRLSTGATDEDLLLHCAGLMMNE